MSMKNVSRKSVNQADIRSCRLHLWQQYKGFGFRLSATSTKPCLIELIESNSPASVGGLKIHDVLLAVNREDVSEADYKDTDNAIKRACNGKGPVKLLVVQQRFHQYIKEMGVIDIAESATVIETPQTMPDDCLNFSTHRTPRTCHIQVKQSGESFGFEAINGENNIGAYVQEIFPNTPASYTPLRKCDRIIEIDDIYVDQDASKSILEKLVKLKSKGTVKLYVVDTHTYEHAQLNKIPLASKDYQKNQCDNKSPINRYDNIYFAPRQLHSPFPNPNISFDNGDDYNESLDRTDVIVACSSSKYLFESICRAGGDSVSKSFNQQSEKQPNAPIICVEPDGLIQSKKIYFIPWQANSDVDILKESIENFISIALETATEDNYQSIAFPAIGCGQYGCSISLVAATMVQEVYRQLQNNSLAVTFVIQPDRHDIYNEFQKQIQSPELDHSFEESFKTCTNFKKALIEVEMGDITKQKVDVIIGSTSSELLRTAIMNAAGNKSTQAYTAEIGRHPNSLLSAIPAGHLPCEQIFFVNWQPDMDEKVLKQSLVDLIHNVVTNMISHRFTSVAFPAIGLGNHGCSVSTVVKTIVQEMKKHLTERDLAWIVKFIVQPGQENVYDEFCQQVLTTQDGFHELKHYALPKTWEKLEDDQVVATVSPTTDEYRTIASTFMQDVQGKCQSIIKIERIQNERWYMQYFAHLTDFEKRLRQKTEKRLYHGCPADAATSIMSDCFNRSFAGVNGVAYGVGVYFSSNAAYSHGYTRVNVRGERCMFVARVLVGKTTIGNNSMKTRPLGFDSTTDGNHIFVTYHDAQAFAEYLITYK